MKFEYGNAAKCGGIYQIKNLSNGRVYIGSTAKFTARWSQHKRDLLGGYHSNRFLQNDFNKCGSDSFVFTVLEVIAGNKQARQAAEQIHLDKHYDNQKLCYNLQKSATTSRENVPSKNPEVTRAKLSESSKRAWKDAEYVQRQKESRSTPEAKQARVQAASKWSNENREKLIVSGKKAWESLVSDTERFEAYKQRASENAKRIHSDPELKRKMRESHSKPEVRKIMSDKAKERMADPEFRNNISRQVSERHANDPEFRAKNLEGLKRAREAMKTPENQEKMRLAVQKRAEKQRANARTVTLLDPSGSLVVIQNLNEWCKNNGFHSSRFYGLISGDAKSCKGYTLAPSQSLQDAPSVSEKLQNVLG